jgi:predicted RNA binding protein YcfA (HicA-like mRNA interferase family)
MPHLPVISGDEFCKAIAKIGYALDHTEGSHMIMLNSTGHRLSVPRHREMGRGLLRALIRETGLSREEFLSLLQK